AGQVVVLVLGDDPAVEDLDLCLYGSSIPSGLCSKGTGSIELVVAPTDDDYFVDVFPYAGCNCGGTYTLSIGPTVPPAAARAERTDVEFVPGELIVRLRDPSSVAAQSAARGLLARPEPAPGLPESLGLEKAAGDPSRELLVRLPAGAARARTLTALGVGAQSQMLSAQGLPSDQLDRVQTLMALK